MAPPGKNQAVEFTQILEELEGIPYETRPMFGCRANYVDGKIVLIFRDRPKNPRDNGLWLVTVREHHESLRRDFPMMRSHEIFGACRETGWQVLPLDDEDFEEAAMKACRLVRQRDPRIGKIPPKKKRTSKKTASKKARPKTRTTKRK